MLFNGVVTVIIVLVAQGCLCTCAQASPTDITSTRVLYPQELAPAASVLINEVSARTGVVWDSTTGVNTIVLALGPDSPSGCPPMSPAPDSFVLCIRSLSGITDITVTGTRLRAIVFGVGQLLRSSLDYVPPAWNAHQPMRGPIRQRVHVRVASAGTARGRVLLRDTTSHTSTPKTYLRGHMISYRGLSNSYDGWGPTLVEAYIRDLAVWGVNQVEMIAPDGKQSPHFPIPPHQMLGVMSNITVRYDLNVSIWVPMKSDASWGDDLWPAIPHLDALFVPGGDPGGFAPSTLFEYVGRAVPKLWQYHPNAEVWVSNQGLNETQLAQFYHLVNNPTTRPPWLTGIVYGPHTRTDLTTARASLSADLPIRLYPDVCHQMSSQYPQPAWDRAFSFTLAREGPNPRQTEMHGIASTHLSVPGVIGFGAYSDGPTDDVNKVIWARAGWDPTEDVSGVIDEYARYYTASGTAVNQVVAAVITGLESNWHGVVEKNSGVDAVTAAASALVTTVYNYTSNWRVLMLVYRAHYDMYEKYRKIQELSNEVAALASLSSAGTIGADRAMDLATADLARQNSSIFIHRDSCFKTARYLNLAIKMKLSVPLYGADSIGRGASLDTIDVPLNNVRYLTSEFARIRTLPNEAAKLDAIAAITEWDLGGATPGGTSYHDNLGVAGMMPHLVVPPTARPDPSFYILPNMDAQQPYNISTVPVLPISWYTWEESFFDQGLTLSYTGLSPSLAYVVVVVYGTGGSLPVRLVANNITVVQPYTPKPLTPTRVRIPLPLSTTSTGNLTLTWNQLPGDGGDGMGCKVAEVWLVPASGD